MRSSNVGVAGSKALGHGKERVLVLPKGTVIADQGGAFSSARVPLFFEVRVTQNASAGRPKNIQAYPGGEAARIVLQRSPGAENALLYKSKLSVRCLDFEFLVFKRLTLPILEPWLQL